jgi:hypothetical protein
MLTPNLTERIRSIFLHHEARVTIAGAARLLGLSPDELAAAVRAGEVEVVGTCSGAMIDIRELAEQAVHLWPLATIEEALGREASLVLPAGVRTQRFALRLPRYLVAALERLAEENEESAEALLTRELHGLAWTHRERLGEAIPGFAEAVEWPLGGEAGLVS